MIERAIQGDLRALRARLRARPYATLASAVGIGWVLGRSFSARILLAIVGIGAHAALGGAVENAVRDRFRAER